MTKIPRDYQEAAMRAFFDYFEAGNKGNPIISAATGSGKSLILAELIKRIMHMFPGQRILMATHVADLISQNAKTFLTQYPDAQLGIYSAGLGRKQPWQPVVFGGIQSMHRQAEKIGHRDIMFIDECHLLSPKDEGMYMSFVTALKKINPALKVVGLSATAWRQKGGSLIKQKNAIFTDIIYDIPLGYLIKEGYLTPLAGKSSVVQADLSGVKKIGGEFNLSQLQLAMDKEELTNKALDEVERVAKDRKHFLFFTSGVKHANSVCANLRARGWDCDVITGDTSQTMRDKYLTKFRNSRTRYALINNTVLTTGTDLPNVDCVVLLRGTQSSSLYIQICGRACRTVYAHGYNLNTKEGRLNAIKYGQKPNALLLDYAGNVERFGAVDLIEAPVAYDSKKKGDNDEPISPPQKICPNCRESIHIVMRQCHCGYEFPEIERINHQAAATNLAVISTEIKPVVHKVHSVQYRSHIAKSGRPCLRVQYYDQMGHIASEYMHFSRVGDRRKEAEQWFRTVAPLAFHDRIPGSTEEALAMKHLYLPPKAITTKKAGKYLNLVDKQF